MWNRDISKCFLHDIEQICNEAKSPEDRKKLDSLSEIIKVKMEYGELSEEDILNSIYLSGLGEYFRQGVRETLTRLHENSQMKGIFAVVMVLLFNYFDLHQSHPWTSLAGNVSLGAYLLHNIIDTSKIKCAMDKLDYHISGRDFKRE